MADAGSWLLLVDGECRGWDLKFGVDGDGKCVDVFEEIWLEGGGRHVGRGRGVDGTRNELRL